MLLDDEKGRVFPVDKPLKWTSFDVVAKLRYALSKKLRRKKVKVGHAGTLDPLATGLLIVCAGKATKTISQIQDQTKEYTGTITLGATTPSYDLESEPDEFFDYEHLKVSDLQKAAQSLTGEYDQMPPAFSAKKIKGKKAYELARKGESPELKTKRISIDFFELTNINLPEISFKVRCSKGTYIRSLAYDFGKKLNSGAYLSGLRRTAIGNHRVEDAYTVNEALKIIEEADVEHNAS